MSRTQWIITGLVLTFITVQLTTRAMENSGLWMNYSNSLPLGLYRAVPDGEYAGICLTYQQAKRAAEVGVGMIPGNCPGSVSPILKPLTTATPEKPVAFGPDGFTVNGQLIPNTAPKPYSRTHAPLIHFPFGTYTSGLWAINSYTPDSYDSRYLGNIMSAQIKFYADPVLTK